MPVITVEAAKLTKEQKAVLTKEMTETASRVMNLPPQTIFVFLKENESDNVGVGGILLSDKK